MSPCRLKCKVCSTSSRQMFRLSLVPRGFWSKDAGDIALKLCFCDFTALELSCSKLNVNMWHPLLNLSISKIACRRMHHVMLANYACLCHVSSFWWTGDIRGPYANIICPHSENDAQKKWPIALIYEASTLFLSYTRIWKHWALWLRLCQVDQSILTSTIRSCDRFSFMFFTIFHRVVSRYCGYLLPKQTLGTHAEKK